MHYTSEKAIPALDHKIQKPMFGRAQSKSIDHAMECTGFKSSNLVYIWTIIVIIFSQILNQKYINLIQHRTKFKVKRVIFVISLPVQTTHHTK